MLIKNQQPGGYGFSINNQKSTINNCFSIVRKVRREAGKEPDLWLRRGDHSPSNRWRIRGLRRRKFRPRAPHSVCLCCVGSHGIACPAILGKKRRSPRRRWKERNLPILRSLLRLRRRLPSARASPKRSRCGPLHSDCEAPRRAIESWRPSERNKFHERNAPDPLPPAPVRVPERKYSHSFLET